MKKLTNESKARFFALNQGSKLKVCENEYTKEFIAFDYSIFERDRNVCAFEYKDDTTYYDVDLDYCKLIKTPLQNISDEHAIECLRIREHLDGDLEFINAKVTSRGKNSVGFTVSYKKYADAQKWIVFSDRMTTMGFQYLQSQGYAMSYYCPIENRIIPVQEQIDNGWITLNNQ